jgi:hypothetical protein
MFDGIDFQAIVALFLALVNIVREFLGLFGLELF